MHFHTLVAQGVFADDGAGELRFVPLPAPTDREVERLLGVVRRRVVRLARRHGIDLAGDGVVEVDRVDAQMIASPALAGMAGASVAGRAALGAEAGQSVLRLGRASEGATEERPLGPCHAREEGFDLHAAVAVPAGGQERLEHLCRYVLRPPIAQGSLALSPGGRVVLTLRRPWRDGTRAIAFDPLDFLARLAALAATTRQSADLSRSVRAACRRSRGGGGSRAAAHGGLQRWRRRPGRRRPGSRRSERRPPRRGPGRRRPERRRPGCADAAMLFHTISSRRPVRAAALGSAGPTSCGGYSRSTSSSAPGVAAACAWSLRSTTRR